MASVGFSPWSAILFPVISRYYEILSFSLLSYCFYQQLIVLFGITIRGNIISKKKNVSTFSLFISRPCFALGDVRQPVALATDVAIATGIAVATGIFEGEQSENVSLLGALDGLLHKKNHIGIPRLPKNHNLCHQLVSKRPDPNVNKPTRHGWDVTPPAGVEARKGKGGTVPCTGHRRG